MSKIKVVGFDLDGTLATEDYDKHIWNSVLTDMYAERHGVSKELAEQKIYAEFYRGQHIENMPMNQWTDLEYWFGRFELGDQWQALLDQLSDNVQVFPDTIECLNRLKDKYRLVVVSNANKKFEEVKMSKDELRSYFERVFLTSDMNTSGKTPDVFIEVCKSLDIKPEEMVFVGNSYISDYDVPMEAGVRAFFLDRSGKATGNEAVRDLNHFADKVDTLEK